jgi:hypothetical protein
LQVQKYRQKTGGGPPTDDAPPLDPELVRKFILDFSILNK